VGDQALQKAIDYACGAGADCSPILQNGACFQPNTVKDHCNYAVNSYFQRKGQGQGSCDFAGAATPSQNPPSKWPPFSSHLKKIWTFLIKFLFFLLIFLSVVVPTSLICSFNIFMCLPLKSWVCS